MIRALRVGSLGRRYRGACAGQLFALLPEPVDADACLAAAGFSAFADGDDREFERLVAGCVAELERRFAAPVVVAPPRRRSWLARLQRFGNRPQDITNPGKLAPIAALTSAARDDSDLEFASVEFGPQAYMFSSDGHPILWIWLDDDVARGWSEILDAAAGVWPHSALQIAWETLLPTRPQLAGELARAILHWGETASWTNGAHVLGFQAGLAARPHEVYLPPAREWDTAAPSWAAALRGAIVDDFEGGGAKVVDQPGAPVFDNYRRPGVDP